MHATLSRTDRLFPTILLACLAATWMGGVGALAEVKLHSLASSWAYDLAFFHNMLFNTVHGDWFVQTSSPHEAHGLFSLHHTYPILVALLPLYAVFQKVDTLLWIQVAAVASAAFPVARLARRAGATAWESTTLAACFLLQMPLVMTALCDFRPIVLSIPLLLWTLTLVYERRRWWALVLAAATLTVREDMVYLLVALGAVAAVVPMGGRRRPWTGGGICALAIVYWLALKGIGGELTYYFDPGELGASGKPSMPEPIGRRLVFLLPYALPFGLLAPLATPLLAPGALVGVYLLVLSPYEWADWSGVYGHHAAPLLASVGGAAAAGWAGILRRIPAFRRRYALAGLVAVHVALLAWLAPGHVRRTVTPSGLGGDDLAAVHSLLQEIDDDEAVACDYRAMALLSGRPVQYAVADFRFTEADRFPHSGADFPPGFELVDVVLVFAEDEPAVTAAAAGCAAFALAGEAAGFQLYRRTGSGGGECSAEVRSGL